MDGLQHAQNLPLWAKNHKKMLLSTFLPRLWGKNRPSFALDAAVVSGEDEQKRRSSGSFCSSFWQVWASRCCSSVTASYLTSPWPSVPLHAPPPPASFGGSALKPVVRSSSALCHCSVAAAQCSCSCVAEGLQLPTPAPADIYFGRYGVPQISTEPCGLEFLTGSHEGLKRITMSNCMPGLLHQPEISH